MIADVGITALCEAGAALFTGPGADRAGLLHVHRSCCRHVRRRDLPERPELTEKAEAGIDRPRLYNRDKRTEIK
ncbi:hypothetical protein ABZ938_30250 [Streptomyces sp. NPDC046409]|uniref:hypothetical protein n=1 Tax=Streptomyces sp. NPDC046409 TaxID=3156675 RepID=UPI0033FA9B13